jgi:hypothetical protein
MVRLEELKIEYVKGRKSNKGPTDTADRKILGELEKEGRHFWLIFSMVWLFS